MHAAEAVLRDTEYSLLLTFGSSGQPFEQRVRALSGKVDGLLVAEEVMALADLRRLTGRILVTVIAGRRDETGLDVVLADNTGGIAALVAHLAGEHGYQRLCFVTGPPDAPDARERQAAFENAVLASPRTSPPTASAPARARSASAPPRTPIRPGWTPTRSPS